jgi:hypothetical protein
MNNMDESEGCRRALNTLLEAGNKADALVYIKDNAKVLVHESTLYYALVYDCDLDVIWAILDAGAARNPMLLSNVLVYVNEIYHGNLDDRPVTRRVYERCPAWNLMLAGFALVECGASTRGLNDLKCPPMILEHATRCDAARLAAAHASLVFYACLRQCRSEICYLARYIAAFNCERLKWRNWIL